ncbi:unnamed protein product [Porites evermanni]|uniref:G-protein coupled receptors family 1 profile domain-containing protein n=1 Tax=Porites evermanni TaxID=104178 RepID=A0ABN8MXB0_9CNID|nr:unnamed protein product [Porites evermanni]
MTGAMTVFKVAMNSFTSYSAIMLNIVAIIALRKTPSLPKPLKILLLSISASDLCVGLLVQPLYVALAVIDERNPIFAPLARVNTIAATIFCTATLLGICAVSVDRFLAIHLHLRYQEIVTHRRVEAVVISIWVLSAVLSLPRTRTLSEKVNRIILAIMVFITLGCLVAIAIIYVKLYVVLKHHIMQVQALNINLDSQTTVAIEDTARQKKCAVAIFYLYLTLLICYLPNACVALMIVVDASFPFEMINFSDALVYLNSSLDPLIYCWKMRQVRLAVMNILRNIHFRC